MLLKCSIFYAVNSQKTNLQQQSITAKHHKNWWTSSTLSIVGVYVTSCTSVRLNRLLTTGLRTTQSQLLEAVQTRCLCLFGHVCRANSSQNQSIRQSGNNFRSCSHLPSTNGTVLWQT